MQRHRDVGKGEKIAIVLLFSFWALVLSYLYLPTDFVKPKATCAILIEDETHETLRGFRQAHKTRSRPKDITSGSTDHK